MERNTEEGEERQEYDNECDDGTRARKTSIPVTSLISMWEVRSSTVKKFPEKANSVDIKDKTPNSVRNKKFSRTTTLNSMIRTITVEENVLKQQVSYDENEKTSVQTSKLIDKPISKEEKCKRSILNTRIVPPPNKTTPENENSVESSLSLESSTDLSKDLFENVSTQYGDSDEYQANIDTNENLTPQQKDDHHLEDPKSVNNDDVNHKRITISIADGENIKENCDGVQEKYSSDDTSSETEYQAPLTNGSLSMEQKMRAKSLPQTINNTSLTNLNVDDISPTRISKSRSTECLRKEIPQPETSCMMIPESLSLEDIFANNQRISNPPRDKRKQSLKQKLSDRLKILK